MASVDIHVPNFENTLGLGTR